MTPAAREAWLDAVEQFSGNPSSQHRLGQRAYRALETATEELAEILNCDPEQIIWTSGATEANNLALHQFKDRASDKHPILAAPFEHPSVSEPLKRWFQDRMATWPLDSDRNLDYEWCSRELRKWQPAAVVAMAANNETGGIQDFTFIADICDALEIPYFCDATQYVGRLPARELGKCSYLTASAHKFGGPRGVGFLKIPKQVGFKPMFFGGAQQEERRAGTENLPGILSMVVALKDAEKQIRDSSYISLRQQWKENFEKQIVDQLPGTTVIAESGPRLWNTSAMIMPMIDCRHRWVVRLDRKGIAASTGSACASGTEAPSETLLALGFTAAEANRALRFSSGLSTTEHDWIQLAETLETIYKEF